MTSHAYAGHADANAKCATVHSIVTCVIKEYGQHVPSEANEHLFEDIREQLTLLWHHFTTLSNAYDKVVQERDALRNRKAILGYYPHE